jgi:hypothetical protein
MYAELSEPKTCIIGGGISGLYAALCLVDSGQTNVHVYEALNRLGGKIRSDVLNGLTFNMGGEFIDTDDELTIALCKRLGLNLIECTDQKEYGFQGPNGEIVNDFLSQYAPISEKIIADRREIQAHPDGMLSHHLKRLSLIEYITEISHTDPLKHIPPLILEIAMESYAGEVGQPPQNISATQFIEETMRCAQKFLVSDCGYRVERGTEAIIELLQEYLLSHGVLFHFGERLESVVKQSGGNIKLRFVSSNGSRQENSDKVIIGLPAYALCKVDGLPSFGLPFQIKELLENVQYANLIKFTLAVKPGVCLPNINLFSVDVQSYSPAPGYITFLSHNRKSLTPALLLKENLQLYAAGLGKSAEELFDTSPEHIIFENPGNLACFSTPSPEHRAANEQLFKQLESLAHQGMNIVGTYFPYKGAIGFMECGLASVQRLFNNNIRLNSASCRAYSTSFKS